MHAEEDAIQEFIKNQERILPKQEQARVRSLRFVPKEYVGGEEFLYLGDHYRLELGDTRKPPLALDGGGFHLDRAAVPRAAAVFERWYRERALQVMSERVGRYAATNGFDYRQIKITGARMQWRSCGPQGNLRFAWRLVMAPVPIIDYVVAHELVHLRHKNHSKRFWGKVKAILPEFRQVIDWLEENGYLLNL